MSDEYQVRRDIDRLIGFLNSLEQRLGLSSSQIIEFIEKRYWDESTTRTAIQELQLSINDLDERVTALENNYEELDAKVQALEGSNDN